MRAFLKFRTTKTERQLLRMQAANKVIVLEDHEDVTKLNSLHKKSLQELRNLAIAEVEWDYINISRIRFTLNDRQTCRTSYFLDKCHYKFDPKTKITDVEVIINRQDDRILQINFLHEQKRIVAAGAE